MLNKDELKYFILKKNYKKCCEILEKEIKHKIIKKIRKVDPEYRYIDIYDLIDTSNVLLKEPYKNIAENIRFFSENEDYEDTLKRLMELYEITEEL